MEIDPGKISRGLVRPEELVEIIYSVEECSALESRNFLEIGVFRADTSLGILQVLNCMEGEFTLTCVDIDEVSRLEWERKCLPICGKSRTQFFKCESSKASKNLEHLAWALIDGCHCYECVKGDIDVWGPKIVKDGYLLLHDTDPRHGSYPADQVHGNEKRRVEVNRAVRDSSLLKREFRLVRELYAIPPPPVMPRRLWGGLMVYKRNTDEQRAES